MSKIICDVCGTSFSDTSTQCPICGSVHQGDSLISNQSNQDVGGYTYVKGGRFSKNNVKKRTNGAAGDNSKGSNSTGLIIVIILLILIVATMIAIIAFGIFNRDTDPSGQEQSQIQPSNVACSSLSLSQSDITLDAVGAEWMLYATCTPSNTTDKVIYSVDKPEVATVSSNGSVVCVGEGTATITVQCGEQVKTCKVTCVLPTEDIPQVTVAPEGIHLNRVSITADFEGFEWILYSGKVPVSDIDWSSDDSLVATFQDGIVVAVGEGETMVHADYNGVRTSCKIICDFDLEEDIENGEQPPTLGTELTLYSQYGNALNYNEDIQAYDVMISVGESVGLYLKDSNGMTAQVTWSIIEGNSCEFDGEYFTAINSASNCMVEAEVNGQIYRCLIRTKN